MPLGRPSKPLFDLLPRGEAGRTTIPAPPAAPPSRPMMVEPKPMPRYMAPAAPRPHPAEPETDEPSERQFVIPVTAVYIGITALCLLLIATWIFGVKAGQADVKRQMGARLAQEDEAPRSAQPVTQEPDGSADRTQEPIHTPPAPPAPESTSGRFYTVAGWSETDPREKGLNYLTLPAFDREVAVRVVKYLGDNKLAAAAVPAEVDRKGPGDKNPAQLRVVVLQGLSREQHGEAGSRSRIEQTVRAIGAKWKKDERNAPDLTSSFWVKH